MLYCFEEKGTGALLFSGEGNRYSTVLGEGRMYSTVIRKVGEGNWSSIDLRRSKLVHPCK